MFRKRQGPTFDYNALLMGKSPRCKVEDCHRPAWALNLCQTHYRYWKRHQAGGKTDIPPPSQPKRDLVIHQISSGVRDKPEPSGVMVLAACRVWLRKRGLTCP